MKIWSALYGDVNTVSLLLQNKAGVDVANKWGNTALHCACSSGNPEVVKLLTETGGADPTARNIVGQTPLHSAALNGHTAVVSLLLDQLPADIDSVSIITLLLLIARVSVFCRRCAAESRCSTVVVVVVG